MADDMRDCEGGLRNHALLFSDGECSLLLQGLDALPHTQHKLYPDLAQRLLLISPPARARVEVPPLSDGSKLTCLACGALNDLCADTVDALREQKIPRGCTVCRVVMAQCKLDAEERAIVEKAAARMRRDFEPPFTHARAGRHFVSALLNRGVDTKTHPNLRPEWLDYACELLGVRDRSGTADTLPPPAELPADPSDADLFARGLLGLCHDLRAQASGKVAPWPAAVRARVLAYLRRRFDSWAPSVDAQRELYDATVKQLVGTTLGAAADSWSMPDGSPLRIDPPHLYRLSDVWRFVPDAEGPWWHRADDTAEPTLHALTNLGQPGGPLRERVRDWTEALPQGGQWARAVPPPVFTKAGEPSTEPAPALSKKGELFTPLECKHLHDAIDFYLSHRGHMRRDFEPDELAYRMGIQEAMQGRCRLHFDTWRPVTRSEADREASADPASAELANTPNRYKKGLGSFTRYIIRKAVRTCWAERGNFVEEPDYDALLARWHIGGSEQQPYELIRDYACWVFSRWAELPEYQPQPNTEDRAESPLYYCVSPNCPGYSYRASETKHPWSTCGSSTKKVE